MDQLRAYVEEFNRSDEEIYPNEITNSEAYEFLSNEIPLFECPDPDLERTYYFRWWTFRKHIRKRADNYVITEFLPDVPWSGKYNTINAPIGHHLAEGRWLRHAERYLKHYYEFFLRGEGNSHSYSVWLIHAIRDFYAVRGGAPTDRAFLDLLVRYYERWEREHGLPSGMFWSLDDRDAMEFSISGTKDNRPLPGIRPTLNSYMCADALALAHFARGCGDEALAKVYEQKHALLKEQILSKLWHEDFFKAFHYDTEAGEDENDALTIDKTTVPRELLGYIPWCFDIPDERHDVAFAHLTNEGGFRTPIGLATAEQRDTRFLFEADHECLWNGYVWPFATSQTLNALLVRSRKEGGEPYSRLFIEFLMDYARQHVIEKDGKTLPWIDEVMHPYRKEWTSRSLLEAWGWQARKGGYERGKDYNHSTFCDLVISGIVGITPTDDGFTVQPRIPENWSYFRLDNLPFRGELYTVTYDKDGTKYGEGIGLTVKKTYPKTTSFAKN